MRAPPRLTRLLHYPVCAHVGAAAISLTLAWTAGVDVSFLMEDYHIWRGEPWRLLTSAILHAGPIHLVFNLMFLWYFGTVVEEELGALRTIGIFAVFAAGSAAAEYAFFEGGVGLSGIGFGIATMLWVLSRRDPRFAGAIDWQTIQWLIALFFICILLTISRLMPIANVAHAAGAALGYLMGWAISARTRRHRLLWWAAFVATLLLFLALSWRGRPYVNFSPYRGYDLYNDGTEALEAKRYDEAIDLLREAVRLNPKKPDFWHNLAVAYVRAGRTQEAQEAFAREGRLRPVQLAPDNLDQK